MDKNILIEAIKSAVKHDISFKSDILAAIKDNKEMDDEEALKYIKTLTHQFVLNRDYWVYYTDPIYYFYDKFRDFVYHNIGYHYSRDKKDRDQHVFDVLDSICSRIDERAYNRFLNYYKNNYNSPVVDIFFMKRELLEKLKNE